MHSSLNKRFRSININDLNQTGDFYKHSSLNKRFRSINIDDINQTGGFYMHNSLNKLITLHVYTSFAAAQPPHTTFPELHTV
jgi:hypothetical protein